MTKSKQALSRRELLKALTALGGAAAASSLLPEKWAKPQVGAGVLPAHAQSTLRCIPPYTIVDCGLDAQIEALQEGFRIFGTTAAWISPPCPGIELSPSVLLRIESQAKPDAPTPNGAITDPQGKASVDFNVTINIANQAAPAADADLYLKGSWEFSNPGDGSGFCETEELHFDLVLPPPP
jgi:hypothetical protein